MPTSLSTAVPAQRPLPAIPRPEPASPPPALSVRTHGVTNRGPRRRTNEDRFLIASPASALWVSREGKHACDLGFAEIEGDLFAVADGFGPPAGGIASAVALDAVSSCLLSTLRWVFALGGPEAGGAGMLDQIQTVFNFADRRVREEAACAEDRHDMGTTLTMAYRHGQFLYVGHVGDSACYLLRGRKLRRVTREHAAPGGAGTEAGSLAVRHMISASSGAETAGLKVDVHRVRLVAGDVLLLCTAGLSTVVTESEIAAILAGRASATAACERLVERAAELDGPENVTAVVARFDRVASRPRAPRARRPSQA